MGILIIIKNVFLVALIVSVLHILTATAISCGVSISNGAMNKMYIMAIAYVTVKHIIELVNDIKNNQ